MQTTVHPVILIAGLCAIAAFIAAAFAVRASSVTRRVVLGGVAVVFIIPAVFVFLLLHPELIDGRFRTYKTFYRDIHEGMTRDEVNSLLDRHYPKAGARLRPKVMEDTPERLGFFMNPETSREPNCEGIFLSIHEGHVATKSYSED